MATIPPDQKFHTIDPTTPTPERGSIRTNNMHEIYTMQDIIDTVSGGGGGVTSLETLTGDLILQGAGGVTISNNGSDTITITGGATIGEKLDFTVRDTAYTGVTGEHEGIDLKVANTSVTAGLVYGLGEAAGPVPEWLVSDASIVTSSSVGLLAVATATGSGVNMMQKGLIVMSGFGGFKNGTNLYLSASTPGTVTATPPSGTGEVVRLVGYLVDQTLDLVYFDPSQDWIEII